MNISKKQWYVVADAKGLQIYKNCDNKADAEQLCKNLQNLFNPNIIFWVDFNWRADKKYTDNFIHGSYKGTDNIIKDCSNYVENYCICWN